MARISFSPLIVEASGKVQDTVFSRWKGRAYIRSRVTPANPKSAAQTLVRNSMSRCVDLWQSFQTQIKDAWDLYAQSFSYSGYNAFVKANRVDEQAGNELETTPVSSDVIEAATFSAAGGALSGEIALTWTGGTVGAGNFIYVLTRKAGDNAFVLQSHAAVLMSAGTHTITGLTGGATYQVYLSDETTASNLFSKSIADTAVATV